MHEIDRVHVDSSSRLWLCVVVSTPIANRGIGRIGDRGCRLDAGSFASLMECDPGDPVECTSGAGLEFFELRRPFFLKRLGRSNRLDLGILGVDLLDLDLFRG